MHTSVYVFKISEELCFGWIHGFNTIHTFLVVKKDTDTNRYKILYRNVLHATDAPNATAQIPTAIADYGGTAPASSIFLFFHHIRAPIQTGQQVGGLEQLRGCTIKTGTRTGTAATSLVETLLRFGQQRRVRNANRGLLRKMIAASGNGTAPIVVVIVMRMMIVLMVKLRRLCWLHLLPRACCCEEL